MANFVVESRFSFARNYILASNNNLRSRHFSKPRPVSHNFTQHMPLYKLSESEIRENSKKYLETLEYWLRRVIDNKLTEIYGSEYWNHHDNGIYIIKKEIREKTTDRLNKYSERFSRWIDATLLEHLIDIICKEKLYKEYFKCFFEFNYPLGKEQLRISLSKLSETRNRLYHSNPISIRQAEQVICYTNDIIESIKEFYLKINQQMDFNAPTILSISFSDSTKIFRDAMVKSSNGIIVNKRATKYRCGDRLKMEIEIDSSFDNNEYNIIWNWKNINNIEPNKKDIEIQFTEEHIGETFAIRVKLISNKSWHRFNTFDDELSILLTVLPPI
jgi:hypothetical protein